MKHINNISILKDRRRRLRNEPTYSEKILWNALRNSQLGGRKFRRQHSFGGYILDFYCPSEKLAVELDGEYHSESEQIEYDKKRDIFLASSGIKVLRFDNELVTHKLNTVLQLIEREFREEID